MAYTIKTNEFEGPLDVLLELIQKEKLEITKISLAKVTDQFLAFIDAHEEMQASILSDFLLIASQLLLLKSKVLLPVEEDIAEELSSDELEFRLKEYKKYKEAAKKIKQIFFRPYFLFERQYVKKVQGFYPGENLTKNTLHKILNVKIKEFEKFEEREERAIEKTVTISEKIMQIRKLLKPNKETNFDTIISSSESKVDIIVSFLAMLELIKQNHVTVKQENPFGSLMIETTT